MLLPTIDATVQRGSVHSLITMGHASSIARVLALPAVQLLGKGLFTTKPTEAGALMLPVIHGVNMVALEARPAQFPYLLPGT
jgi:hypothetical protein